MNDLLVEESLPLSLWVQNATRFNIRNKVKDNDFASENLQVMNYGIGGTISAHYDSFWKEDVVSAELLKFGGLRIVTLMYYLTDVELGGRTIFPHSGISVQPEKGSALYWFNFGPDYSIDSRVNHLGCPVLIGNKWIANKWIKWTAQQNLYPCSTDKYFSIIDKPKQKQHSALLINY